MHYQTITSWPTCYSSKCFFLFLIFHWSLMFVEAFSQRTREIGLGYNLVMKHHLTENIFRAHFVVVGYQQISTGKVKCTKSLYSITSKVCYCSAFTIESNARVKTSGHVLLYCMCRDYISIYHH